ncbi:hypothetical protein Tco_1120825 [Tanacetum coccineum]|uniref:MAK10-like protein n=1 Tax=Tanacetum coccineum TaxID=301880 RepID=A0ABQ5IVY9_9ASTR
MASTFDSKSKSFMTMSIPPRDEPSTGGKLRDRNTEDSWALLEDLALYDNESWNNPKDFAKPVKAISLPQYVSSTSDCHLIELEKQKKSIISNSSLSIRLGSRSSELNLFAQKGGMMEMFVIEIIKKYDDSREEELEEDENAITGGLRVEYFDIFPTRSELAYHKYLMSGPIPSLFLRNPIIVGGCQSNLKISCNIRNVHVEKAYIDLNSPLNIMTRMLYNCIMKRKLDPREDPIRGISNFTGRIKGMRIFVGNFTYISDFMIVEDISSIIDGVVRFTNGIDELAYKMPHKIEQYNSLSDLKKEYTKSVYFRNKEDKIRGVDYVMSKILGFYKECLKLGPKYLTGLKTKEESRKGM